MTNSETLAMFKSSGALLDGHFRLTSGRHSNSYFQCAKVLQHPEYLSAICGEIAGHFREIGVTTVISPAIGGIVVGTEVGRQIGVKTIFAERKDGVMSIRRGFEIDPSEKVLVVEDVITTGGSVAEVIDRSNGKVRLADRQYSLLTMEVVSYTPEECPLCRENVPIYAPGSRTNPQG